MKPEINDLYDKLDRSERRLIDIIITVMHNKNNMLDMALNPDITRKRPVEVSPGCGGGPGYPTYREAMILQEKTFKKEMNAVPPTKPLCPATNLPVPFDGCECGVCVAERNPNDFRIGQPTKNETAHCCTCKKIFLPDEAIFVLDDKSLQCQKCREASPFIPLDAAAKNAKEPDVRNEEDIPTKLFPDPSRIYCKDDVVLGGFLCRHCGKNLPHTNDYQLCAMCYTAVIQRMPQAAPGDHDVHISFKRRRAILYYEPPNKTSDEQEPRNCHRCGNVTKLKCGDIPICATCYNKPNSTRCAPDKIPCCGCGDPTSEAYKGHPMCGSCQKRPDPDRIILSGSTYRPLTIGP